MQTVKTTLVILMCVVLLGACGLKGPLYLPEETPVSADTPELESPEETNPENKEKDSEDASGQNVISI